MAVLGVRVISCLYSRKIICSYRSPLISQLRYFRDRLTPINVSNCRLVPLGRRFPERFPSIYPFVRWNSSSTSVSGAQNPDVSILIFSSIVLLGFLWPPQLHCRYCLRPLCRICTFQPAVIRFGSAHR